MTNRNIHYPNASDIGSSQHEIYFSKLPINEQAAEMRRISSLNRLLNGKSFDEAMDSVINRLGLRSE